MPFTYNAFSRRRFLRHSLTVAAGAMAFDQAKAAEADAETWFFLSDCHIAADQAAVKNGVNMMEHLRAVFKEINAFPSKADHMLVNGDLALANGQPGDYQTFGKLLEELPSDHVPIHLTLGNHDHRANFLAGLPKLDKGPIADKYTLAVEGKHMRWLFLDSLKETDMVEGKLGESQIQWIKQELAKEPGASFILVGHHPMNEPMPPDSPKFAKGLDDSAALLHLIESSPQIKAFIFGHTHHWGSWQTPAGAILVNLPPTAYVFDPKQPSGWVEAKITRDGMKLTLHSLDPKHPQQGESKEFSWRKA